MYLSQKSRDGLDVGNAGLGEYNLEISVIVDSGGGIGCSHTDEGMRIEYLVK